MPESNLAKVPETEKLEMLLSGAKAALGLIPFAGGSLAEVVGYFCQRLINDRQKQFLEDVLLRLDQLAGRVDDLPGRLAQNEDFYSTLYHTLNALQRTTNQVKIVALRNAVLTPHCLEHLARVSSKRLSAISMS